MNPSFNFKLTLTLIRLHDCFSPSYWLNYWPRYWPRYWLSYWPSDFDDILIKTLGED